MEITDNMKDIAIYGAGGFGREVACLLKRINEEEPTWNLIGFFDDNIELKDKMVSHYGLCHGGINELNKYDKDINIVVAVGNPIVTKKIVDKINNHNISFPNIIHPSTKCADEETLCIGKGNIVQGDCFFSCDVKIGDFNVLNGSVIFGHDAIAGSYNTFMPAVRISGEVKIGDCNFFGISSIVLQQIKIGNNIRLGAGSVLMTKPKDGLLYIGNPAKKFEI